MDQTTAATRNESYSKMVAAARELARTALRTRNIRAKVEEIAAINLEKTSLVKFAKEQVEKATHQVEKATYQLAKKNIEANLGDPDFEKTSKQLTEALDEAKKDLEEVTKVANAITGETDESMVRLNKEIDECNKKILGWETGENKVQLENVNKLAQEYIEKALNEKARALASLIG